MLVDSHAHLLDGRFEDDRAKVIEKARKEGVEIILNVCEVAEIEAGLRLQEEFKGIYTAAGLHPHNARFWSSAAEEKLIEAARQRKILAIGEIGLDFHYNFSPPEKQLEVFEAQMKLAEQLNLPVIIHSREAWKETLKVLERHRVTGVLHSYTEPAALAEQALRLGYYISFSGIVTFKSASDLRKIAFSIPEDKILVETDCPYLAPVPHRGKRNEPAFVKHTAEFLARLRGEDPEKFFAQVTENFKRLFRLDELV